MSQTDDIHESFYDLFNQRFRRIDDPEHGPRYYANIAIGAHLKPSRVHGDFQCVVVVRKSEVKDTPAPFLNRFEKYCISHQTLLATATGYLPPCIRVILQATRRKASYSVCVCVLHLCTLLLTLSLSFFVYITACTMYNTNEQTTVGGCCYSFCCIFFTFTIITYILLFFSSWMSLLKLSIAVTVCMVSRLKPWTHCSYHSSHLMATPTRTRLPIHQWGKTTSDCIYCKNYFVLLETLLDSLYQL